VSAKQSVKRLQRGLKEKRYQYFKDTEELPTSSQRQKSLTQRLFQQDINGAASWVLTTPIVSTHRFR
jgi:hypothetical protein